MMSFISFINPIDFQRKTYWDFYFDDNPLIRFKIQSTTLPFLKLDIKQLSNLSNYYSDIKYENSFDVTIYEDITFSTYNYFNDWKNSIYDNFTKRFHIPISFPNYYRTGIFSYYATGAILDVPTKVFSLINMRFEGLGSIENNYTEGDALIYTVSMTFDEMKPIF